MARAHAHILTAIWSDPDWIALSQNAQHTYLLLLSQSKLNMVGLLDCLPSRWARLAADCDLASVEAALDELEASRFVLVDHDTDELLVRSLVRHDTASRSDKVANPRVLKALWSAWDAIESRQLRAAVLYEIPAGVWDSPKVQPPAEAKSSRQNVPPERSAEPEEPPEDSQVTLEVSARTSRQNVPHDPVPMTHDPDAVADNKQPVNSRGTVDAEAASVDKSPDVLDEALEVLTDRELARNPTRNGNVERHAAAVTRAKRKDHQAAAAQLIRRKPAITATELADLLEPPVPALRRAAGNGTASAYDSQQAAQRATAERHLRVIAGDACPTCNDTGWTLDQNGTAVPCEHP